VFVYVLSQGQIIALYILIMTTEVNYYRYYCQTESNYVYKWDTAVPATCPNNVGHGIDSNSITIIDTVSSSQVEVVNDLRTQFQESVSVNKKVLISLLGSFGKTTLRNNFATQGSAFILNTGGISSNNEFQMLITSANDKASITSVERVKYCGGVMVEAAFGIRIPQTLTSSNQYIQFGLYDNSNGIYFKYTNSGLGVGFRGSGASDSNVTQSNLNIDIMDGQGLSGVLLQPSKGNMYGIRVSGNGPRSVDYGVWSTGQFYTMHRLFTNDISGSPVLNLNLPLTVEIGNGGVSGSNNVYVADRSYSVYGDCIDNEDDRVNSVYVNGIVINSSNMFVPVASLRKKSTHMNANAYLGSMDVVCTSPQLIMITTGATLTGASWQAMPLQASTETSVEYDTSASVLGTDGIVLWQGYAPSGNITFGNGLPLPKCLMNGQLPLTISAQNVSSSGTVSIVIRTSEAW